MINYYGQRTRNYLVTFIYTDLTVDKRPIKKKEKLL